MRTILTKENKSMKNKIIETKGKTSIIYKIISYISLIYVCYLPIRALTLAIITRCYQ